MIRSMRSFAHMTGIGPLLLLSFAACDDGEIEGAPVDGLVILGEQDVATAKLSTLTTGVALTGNLQPYQMVEVKAQVAGVVTGVAAEEGQAVDAGAALARIEAEGIVSQAAGARSGVAAAQANLALARRQHESARTLFEAGAMSEIEFRTAQAQLEAAQAQLATAEAQAAGAVEQAQRTTVGSPIAGEVSDRSVNEGEAVNPGQTLFTVVNSAFLELQGQVPVDKAAQVREGQSVVFQLDAYPAQEFRGSVERLSPVADPGTRQVGVTLRLPNEDRRLIGGLFATGRVLTGPETEAVVVPESAVRGTGADSHVWVIEKGLLVRRAVMVGAKDDERGVLGITSGVRAGEMVLVAPGDVAEGAPVQMESAPSAPVEGEEG
ncbi:MAG: efflux RND transporter periplasmic adaptor subunit [Gemmatimonas sp.]|nr:efflux RND transporter periplasmic adaptor subunit [Gemmatimonas sp.]